MANAPRGYRREVREVFVKKNSDFSDSQKHEGLKSPLARDKKTNDLSHPLIGARVESESGQSQSIFVNEDHEDGAEISDENAPDISGLVPIALVAVAGLAAGVAGVKIAQSRKRRREGESLSIAAPSAVPAGWYAVVSDPTRLRHWNGTAWTDDYAQRAGTAHAIAADWYPDPSNPAGLRYWDGAAWTHHVSPRPGATTTPADWYPDPSNAARLRYWDGTAWTQHVTSGLGASVGHHQAGSTSSIASLAPAHKEPRIHMSSAEWRAHVEAWVRAGVIQQELWRRLTNVHITDADGAALTAQRQWEELTPQEGARRIQLMLEANPSLRNQSVLVEFVNLFGRGQGTPIGIEGNELRR